MTTATTREGTPRAQSEIPKALPRKLRPGPGRSATEVAVHQRARLRRAMVEIAGSRGYAAVTVREIVGVAGVSSRTFYQLFNGIEECFLDTYDHVVHRAIERINASQAGEGNWLGRLRLAFGAVARELEREPQASRLALIEAYSAGPAALERTFSAEETFKTIVAESLAGAPGYPVMAPLIVEGMVSGIAHAARAQPVRTPDIGSNDFESTLTEWVRAFCCDAIGGLAELDQRATIQNCMASPSRAVGGEKAAMQPQCDEQSLFLSAAAKLAVTEGADRLTVSAILAAAGLTRRSFDVCFSGAEECLLASLELRAGETIARANRARDSRCSFAGGGYQAIAALCAEISADPLLAKACVADTLTLGESGMQFRERLLDDIAAAVLADILLDNLNDLSVKASAGAVGGVIRHYVMSGCRQQLPAIAPTLTLLAQGGIVGVQTTMHAIEEEQTSHRKSSSDAR